MPLLTVRAVSFDVGGTLIDPWPSVGHVYAAVAAEHGFSEADPERLNQQFAATWRAKSNFDYSRAGWAEIVARTFNGPSSRPASPVSFFDPLYERFASPDVWRLHDDVIPAFEALLCRGLKLAAISNWDERLRPLLKHLKLDSYFDVITISSEIGFTKPSPVIFGEAVRKLGLPPESILHVGDGLEEDLQGARGAGMKSFLLNRGDRAKAPGELHSLRALDGLIA